MPNLNDAFASSWLKPNVNVKHGDFVKFVDAGEVVDNGVNEKGQPIKTLQITVEVERTGDTKKFSVNATNRKNVQALYGADTDAWVGKSMQVAINIQGATNPKTGEAVDTIRLLKPGINAQ